MFERRSLKWPITLGVTMIILLILVIVGWILLAVFGALRAGEDAPFYWTVLSVGTVVLAVLISGVVAYLTLSIKTINLNRRQSNFLDSVTHELKSPIASLKLCLQTMHRHPVGPEETATFHKFMLEDVERLDNLITQLLAAGQIEKKDAIGDQTTFDLEVLLHELATAAIQRHGLPNHSIVLDTESCPITTRLVDMEMILRNILDNAIKYGGEPPQVEIWLRQHTSSGNNIVVSVSDNGRGIPPEMRRKIFRRFTRLGSELTREKPGTGLGLYIVRNLVLRLGGKISVHDRESGSGTLFQLELPEKLKAEPLEPQAASDPPAQASAAPSTPLPYPAGTRGKD